MFIASSLVGSCVGNSIHSYSRERGGGLPGSFLSQEVSWLNFVVCSHFAAKYCLEVNFTCLAFFFFFADKG